MIVSIFMALVAAIGLLVGTSATSQFEDSRPAHQTINRTYHQSNQRVAECRPTPSQPQSPPGFYPPQGPTTPQAPVPAQVDDSNPVAVLGIVLTLLAGAAGAIAGAKVKELDPSDISAESAAHPITEQK